MINPPFKFLFPLPLLIWLWGCSTNTPVNHYYLLTPPESDATTRQIEAHHTVVLMPVWLASYLQQGSLVMQTKPHELHFSHNHLWGQRLEQGITQAMLNEMNKQGIKLISEHETSNDQKHIRLEVHIEHFLPTDNAEVLLSGHYRVIHKDSSKIGEHRFYYTQALKNDGYEHAVGQMRDLIGQLTKDIALQVLE